MLPPTNLCDMIRSFLPGQTDGHGVAHISDRRDTTPAATVTKEAKQNTDAVENGSETAVHTPGPLPELVQKPPPATLPPAEDGWTEVVRKTRRSEATVTSSRDAQGRAFHNRYRQRDEVESISENILRLEEEKDALSKSLETTRLKSDRLIAGLENKCRQLEALARKFQQELESTRSQLSDATRALDACRLQQQEMAHLLDIRATELRDAQAALSEPDTISHGAVKRMVDQLNAEVYQMSALMSDHFPFGDRRPSLHTERQPAYARICENVGVGIAHAVMTCSHADDSALVQVIIQAYVVERIWWAFQMWSFTVNPGLINELSDLHEKIFLAGAHTQIWSFIRHTDRYITESQSISARWRSLTKRYLNHVSEQQATTNLRTFKDYLATGLVDILVIAGVPLSNEMISSRVHENFGERILSIVSRTLELRKVVGVDITDSEFEILRPHYGGHFHREFMENIEETGSGRRTAKSQDGQPVLCTTEMGLRRHEKKVGEGNGGFIEESVLIKPKVALYSMVEEFARQQWEEAGAPVRETPDGKNPTAVSDSR